MEKLIVESPEFWLWSHRKWKHKRPQMEEAKILDLTLSKN